MESSTKASITVSVQVRHVHRSTYVVRGQDDPIVRLMETLRRENVIPPSATSAMLADIREYVERVALEESFDLTSPLVVEVDRADDDEGSAWDILLLGLPLFVRWNRVS